MWRQVGVDTTNADGRATALLPPGSALAPGTYRVRFETTPYFQARHRDAPAVFPAQPFYPGVAVDFTVTPVMAEQHFHIPLSLNPFAYSTYRGS